MRIATDHREDILQTAARLFARKPFHEVLMDDVADQTGIAKGTIYRYFPNKEELFAVLSVRYLEKLSGEIAQVGAADPVDKISAMLKRMIEMVLSNYDFFQVMQRRECEVMERKSSEFLDRRSAMRDQFAAQIREAARLGRLKCPHGPVLAADMLLGMVRNVLRFADPVPAPDAIAAMAMDLFLRGCGVINGNGAAKAKKNGRRRMLLAP